MDYFVEFKYLVSLQFWFDSNRIVLEINVKIVSLFCDIGDFMIENNEYIEIRGWCKLSNCLWLPLVDR